MREDIGLYTLPSLPEVIPINLYMASVKLSSPSGRTVSDMPKCCFIDDINSIEKKNEWHIELVESCVFQYAFTLYCVYVELVKFHELNERWLSVSCKINSFTNLHNSYNKYTKRFNKPLSDLFSRKP